MKVRLDGIDFVFLGIIQLTAATLGMQIGLALLTVWERVHLPN